MEPKVRTYVLNIVLAFVPDLVVAWAAMRLTDSGWSGLAPRSGANVCAWFLQAARIVLAEARRDEPAFGLADCPDRSVDLRTPARRD